MPPKPKFVITPFRQPAAMDEEYIERIWATLESAIRLIFAHKASGLSFEELYRNAYNMVLHKHGARLYSGLTECITAQLSDVAMEVVAARDDDFLSVLKTKWSEHKLAMSMTRDIFMYMVRLRRRPCRGIAAALTHSRGVPPWPARPSLSLCAQDRTFVTANKKAPVYDLGLGLFRDVVIRHARIRDRLQNQSLGLVAAERNGELINRALLRQIVAMLVDLGRDVYTREFEKPFLDETSAFYLRESTERLATSSAAEYLLHAEQRLEEEAQRLHHYVDGASEGRLRAAAERALVGDHVRTIAEMERSGLVAMLDDMRLDDLARMYALFKRISEPLNGLAIMRDVLEGHLRSLGRAVVQGASAGDGGSASTSASAAGTWAEVPGGAPAPAPAAAPRDPLALVDALLALKDRYDKIAGQAFLGDKIFQNAINRAFESFVNWDQRAPEFLSLYIDQLLRKEAKSTSEDLTESTLDKLIMLFRYLQEKDVFEKYYKQHLAKRLLGGRIISEDLERAMICRLKAECGFHFTSKIEGMFTDIRTSVDAMTAFREHLVRLHGGGGNDRDSTVETPKVHGVDVVVTVLTTGYWPTQAPSICIFPPELQRCIDAFTRFYDGNHNGRTLKWLGNMGHADLRATFEGSPPRRHEINVSTYQLCILLLFNDRDRISYSEIASATQIPAPDLKRALQSVACAKHKILNKVRRTARGQGEPPPPP